MRRRPSLLRALVTTAVAIAAGLMANLAANTVQVTAGWWPPAVWAALGVLGVASAVLDWRHTRAVVPVSASGLDEWSEGLAQGVEERWRREEDHRRVHDPVALPVSWRPAAQDVIDHWSNIRRVPAGSAASPLVLAGRIEQLADVYRRIPSGRLVILGKAGAGKTVLAARLALDLLAARRPDQPIPVIVSVGSWNPTTASLHTWLADQLTRDHPGLAEPSEPGGPTRADALIAAGRILPILDGFDEINPGLHQAAMRHLNASPDAPVVITSRGPEFTAAASETDVLTAAAAVEVNDLTLDDLDAYLPRTAAGRRTAVWETVLDRLREEPASPATDHLTAVLTTPLMVMLARTIYSDAPGHDPAELLDIGRFPTPEALEDHLLEAFIEAVYQDRPLDQVSGHQGCRHWDSDDVKHWLGYLAWHLDRLGTRDLAWWQLGSMLSPFVNLLAVGLAAAPIFGLLIGAPTGVVAVRIFAQDLGFTIGLVTTLASGLAGGLVIAGLVGLIDRFKNVVPEPSRVQLRIRGRGRVVLERLQIGFGFGLASAVLFYELGRLLGGVGLGWPAVLLVSGVTLGLMDGFMSPIDTAVAVSPFDLLTADRNNVIAQAFGSGLTLGFLLSVWSGFTYGPVYGTLGLLGGIVFGCAVHLVIDLNRSAWGRWLTLACVWLPLTGRLPRGLRCFLDDAYQRGVLRQAGPVYQFRHARLHDHLARSHQAPQMTNQHAPRTRQTRSNR